MNSFSLPNSARRLLPRAAAISLIFAALASVGLGGEPAASTKSKVRDLSSLSLEELSKAEITPINVLGSHTHVRGEWMVGYRFMHTAMAGNLDRARELSDAEVLRRGYTVVHTRMTMDMHMVELMYAPTDKLTLMGMLPFKSMDMDHLKADGVEYRTRSDGLGDFTLMGLYNVFGNPREGRHRLVLNGGFIFPTGSTDVRDRTPTNPSALLEYTMQPGSGTFGLEPGLTYLGQAESFAWGAQIIGTVRVGKNDRGYRLGNEYRVSGWGYYGATDWFGPSVRFDWHDWENIHGADPELHLSHQANPAFDAASQEGKRLDFLMGLNFYVPRALLKGARLTVEGGLPVYQSLAGPNVKTDWLLTVGLSFSFH